MANIYAKNNAELKKKVNDEGQAGRYLNGSKEAGVTKPQSMPTKLKARLSGRDEADSSDG